MQLILVLKFSFYFGVQVVTKIEKRCFIVDLVSLFSPLEEATNNQEQPVLI